MKPRCVAKARFHARLTNPARRNIITPTRGSRRTVADIKSEPRPASNRNRWPAPYRNAWPASSEYAFSFRTTTSRSARASSKRCMRRSRIRAIHAGFLLYPNPAPTRLSRKTEERGIVTAILSCGPASDSRGRAAGSLRERLPRASCAAWLVNASMHAKLRKRFHDKEADRSN